MKLVEILARELEVWPEEWERLEQSNVDGEIYAFCEDGFFIETRIFLTQSENPSKEVTRPQWQAERDRMKAMDTQQATASTEPTYEQQLWDKVASEIFIRACDESIATYKQEEVDYVSVRAAGYADAFMAERAKRVGK